MPFISFEFLAFFTIIFPIYWSFAKKPQIQNIILLISSIFLLYYTISPLAVGVVLLYSFFIFIISKFVYESKFYLSAGIFISAINLFTLKNIDVFNTTLIVPLGISYYTFQAISYLIEIYRGRIKPLSLKDLALYFSFFPTITSGPIIRLTDYRYINGRAIGAAGQIQIKYPRKILRPAVAVSLIILGLTKTWVLSGTLAQTWVNPIFENPAQYNSLDILAAIYSYTLTLFFDFSGYSDMVIGIAMLFGFYLPQNFSAPLLSHNIREFWNRWHISLSTWIRDYIYIPLGGNKHGFLNTQIYLMLAMLLSGFWHGQGANFILWGFLHGAASIILNIGDKIFKGRNLLAKSGLLGYMLAVFINLHFIIFTFVIFRTSSLEETFFIFQNMLNIESMKLINQNTLLYILALLTALIFYPKIIKVFKAYIKFLEKLSILLWSVPLSIILAIVIMLAPNGVPSFIYANF